MSTVNLGEPDARLAGRLLDASALLAIVVAGVVFAWFSRWPWMVTNLVVLGIPLTYLWSRSQHVRAKIRVKFALRFIIFGVVAFDYLCERYGAWTGVTIAPLKFPYGVSVEEIEWTAFYIPLVLCVNEHFFAQAGLGPPRGGGRVFLKCFFYAGLVFVLLPPLHEVVSTYTYVKIGIVLELPVIMVAVIVSTRVLQELFWIGIASGVFNFVFEILALRNGYWSFEGTYVGTVGVMGVRFPTEELLFLVLLSGPATIATYAIYKNWKGI